MDVWKPDRDDDIDPYGWYRPLVEFARAARRAGVLWPVFVDDFEIAGGVARRGRPDISMYRHRTTGGFLDVDDGGQAYKFVRHRRGPQLGRFVQISPSAAVWRAGIPDAVDHTLEPRPLGPGARPTFGDRDPGGAVVRPPGRRAWPPRGRRGHLRLV